MSASRFPGDLSGAAADARHDSAAVSGQVPPVNAARFDVSRVDVTCVDVTCVDLAKLDHVAAAMVRSLPSGLTFALVGTLGAGKTRMTQAIAGALGIDRAEVTSPTFTLVQSHDVPHVRSHDFASGHLFVSGQSHDIGGSAARVRRLHHLDAYRLYDEDEFLDLGVEELFADTTAWTVVEWADRVADAIPPDAVWVSIELEPVAESGVAESGLATETEGGDERRRIVFRTVDVVIRGVLHDLARAITHDPEAEHSEANRSDTGVEDRSDPPCDGPESP